ncbi:MAG: CoB--CoM heterodisulfide reductase iron-sulfur subunit A family protein [Desulfobacterales bacterium]|nr:CoB--CoM heterodisulfide reductase iron-sulfur subunit A family protein [Desulfobacterales bacterium]
MNTTSNQNMEKSGAVAIVGAGIAGIQAALDIANSGFRVYVIEEKPSVGGVMAQLDKTFPTNDCSSCMMGPKLVEMANHPNIEILAYTDVVDITGSPGRFELTLKKKARAIDPEKCVGCGICAAKCPTKVSDEFNIGLNQRKAVYIPYPQAVPLIYTIDKEHCRYFTKGKCRICEKVCKNNAVVFDQPDVMETIQAGAVILSGGFEPFNASLKGEYGHGRFPNVVTSLEYERILSAAGPYQGHIQRLSDGKKPHRIAWIQCVGSREAHFGRPHCSSVCCMYATKQAIITKEHEADIDTTVFYIDMRAHGKGFERFYERAKSQYGVRYIRSLVSRVVPNPEDNTLRLSYAPEGERVRHEEFDMVVLSIGLCPNKTAVDLAKKIGVEVNENGFCITDPLDAVATSRPGIYVCGALQGPKDIPDSVQQGSGAAEKATALLSEVRGTMITERKLPAEKNVAGQAPRIGVFICHCGINIASTVDVKQVAEYAATLPNVTYATNTMFACSTDQQQEIKRLIHEHNLNRVVVASCTPRTHEPLFRDTLREAGLNPYLFELSNIREQDSWVHQGEPEAATQKAKELVRMSVSRARLLEPIYDISYSVKQSGLVIGGGLAGLTAAMAIAEQGYEATLIERTDTLGGNALNLYYTEEGASPALFVQELIHKVESNPLIKVFRQTEISSISGSCGNFTVALSVNGKEQQENHGVIVVATGGEEYKPEEYLYGKNPRVMTQKEFESMLVNDPEKTKKYNRVAMIQCVGSREPDHQYCSRVCCTSAVKNSLKLKELNPSAQISILYRDIRTYGLKETYYTQARQQGVRFFRFEYEQKPKVSAKGDCLEISMLDAGLQLEVNMDADLLVLSAAIRPKAGTKDLSEIMRLPRDEDGFFMEVHPKLRPLDFATAGLFLCGLAQGPKFANEAIAQARGAVSRALTVLSQKEIVSEGVITQVDPRLCRACGECERACPFSAIKVQTVGDRKQAVVTEGLCTGCGACNVACPTGAASLAHFRDNQVHEMLQALCA